MDVVSSISGTIAIESWRYSQNTLSEHLVRKTLGNQSRHIYQRIFNILDLTYPERTVSDKFVLGTKVLENQDVIVQFLDSRFSLDKAFAHQHIGEAAELGSEATQMYVKML